MVVSAGFRAQTPFAVGEEFSLNGKTGTVTFFGNPQLPRCAEQGAKKVTVPILLFCLLQKIPTDLMLEMQVALRAFSRARAAAGMRIAATIATSAMTASNSMTVKPRRRRMAGIPSRPGSANEGYRTTFPSAKAVQQYDLTWCLSPASKSISFRSGRRALPGYQKTSSAHKPRGRPRRPPASPAESWVWRRRARGVSHDH